MQERLLLDAGPNRHLVTHEPTVHAPAAGLGNACVRGEEVQGCWFTKSWFCTEHRRPQSLSCHRVENCCNTSASCHAGRERMQEWRCAKTRRHVREIERTHEDVLGDAPGAGKTTNFHPSFKARPRTSSSWGSRQTHKLTELWS